MEEALNRSLEAYQKYLTEYKRRPTEEEWNQLAKKCSYLSSISMRYLKKIKFKR